MSAPSHRRGPWSQAEDAYLMRLVRSQGASNWVHIAQLIKSRSPKQCRERYHQNLKPTLNHEPISPEEGLLIERLVGEIGKRWAEIARRLDGRSDNAVKNWWNGSINRRKRHVARHRISNHSSLDFPSPSRNTFSHQPSQNFSILATSPYWNPSSTNDFAVQSPSASTVSKAESVDGAPSLVSDTGSAFSVSPRLATSPVSELPPFNSLVRGSRKQSVSMLCNEGYAETSIEARACESRRHSIAEVKVETNLPRLVPGRADRHALPLSFTLAHSYGAQSQLPPISYTLQQPLPAQHHVRHERTTSRDSRMHLSSLLG